MTRTLFARTTLRRVLAPGLGAICAAALLAAGVASPNPAQAQAEDWPSQPMTMVVAFSPGGYNDRLARAMANYLQQDLGQPVVVENRPGAGALVAHTHVLDQPDDGHTILASVAMPYLAVNTLVQGADFEVEDFSFINLPRRDYTLLMTSVDKPYQDLTELVEEIRANPGQVSVGVGAPGSSDYMNMILFLNAIGVDEEDLRVVIYSGGNPLRLAVIGGHVDFALVGADASIGQAELFRPLMVFHDEVDEVWEGAMSFPDAMQALDTSGEYIPGSIGGFAVSTAFREQHPDRWEKLVAAFQAVSDDPERVAELEAQGLSADWLGPEASARLIAETMAVYENHPELMEAP